MNAKELLEHVQGQAVIVNETANSARVRIWGMGFAVPIPDGADEEAKIAVDTELLAVMWEFQRLKIGGREYYVLFP